MRTISNKKKIFSRLSIFLIVLVIFSFTLSSFIIITNLNDRSKDSMILSEGYRATGTITDKVIGDDSSNEIVYTFTTFDRKHITTRMPDRWGALFGKVDIGSSISIAYDPANPNDNFPVERGVQPLWNMITDVALFIVVGIGALICLIIGWLANLFV